MKKIFYLIFIVLTLHGCNSNNSNVLGEKKISKEQFGENWPFTVNDGVLKCIQYEAENINPEMIQGVIFENNGKIYGINGVAKSWGKSLGYSNVEDIWADDTKAINELISAGVPRENAKLKKDISVILEEGLKLCK